MYSTLNRDSHITTYYQSTCYCFNWFTYCIRNCFWCKIKQAGIAAGNLLYWRHRLTDQVDNSIPAAMFHLCANTGEEYILIRKGTYYHTLFFSYFVLHLLIFKYYIFLYNATFANRITIHSWFDVTKYFDMNAPLVDDTFLLDLFNLLIRHNFTWTWKMETKRKIIKLTENNKISVSSSALYLISHMIVYKVCWYMKA